jgi:hypothetical protein
MRPLAKGQIISFGDLYSQYLPWFTFAKRTILSGQLPLWTPYEAAGKPLLASTVSGFLYPINWVILLLDVPIAILFIQLSGIFIGMVGMVLYLRYLKIDWLGTILGTLLVGYVLSGWSYVPFISSTLCWLPIIFLLSTRLIDRPSLNSCAALTAPLALAFLAGFLQHFYFICAVLCVYVLILLFFSRRQYDFRALSLRLGLIGSALLLTICLVSVQLLPTMELSLNSARDFTKEFSMKEDPWAGFSFLESIPFYYNSAGVRSPEQLLMLPDTFYVGLSLLLIPFSLGSRRLRPVVIGLLTAVLFTMLYILSRELPALAMFGKLPLSGSFRGHVRMLPIGEILAAALIAIGLNSYWERSPMRLCSKGSKRPDWFWLAVVAFLLALIFPWFLQVARLLIRSPAYLAILLPAFCSVLLWLLHRSNLSSRLRRLMIAAGAVLSIFGIVTHRDMFVPVGYELIILHIIAFLIMLQWNASRISPHMRRAVVWMIAVFLILDVVSHRRFVSQPVPAKTRRELSDRLSSDPGIRWVTDHAGYDRVLIFDAASVFNPNVGTMLGFFNINSYDTFIPARWRNYVLSAVNPYGNGSTTSGSSLERSFYGFLNQTSRDRLLSAASIWGLASLRYYITYDENPDREMADNKDKWTLIFTGTKDEHKVRVYENRFALPRAYLVDNYAVANNETESLQQVMRNSSKLSHSVILEGSRPSFPPDADSSELGHVRFTRYEPNEVEMFVEAREPALVVLTDSYYPGWYAYVDGRATRIWPANSLFRAVEVPGGVHTVLFLYRPKTLAWGFVISVLTMVFLLAGLLITKRGGQTVPEILQ